MQNVGPPTSSLGHLLPKGEGKGFPTLSRGERVAAMRRRVRGLVPRPPIPELSNCYCLPGRAGGSPNGLVLSKDLS